MSPSRRRAWRHATAVRGLASRAIPVARSPRPEPPSCPVAVPCCGRARCLAAWPPGSRRRAWRLATAVRSLASSTTLRVLHAAALSAVRCAAGPRIRRDGDIAPYRHYTRVVYGTLPGRRDDRPRPPRLPSRPPPGLPARAAARDGSPPRCAAWQVAHAESFACRGSVRGTVRGRDAHPARCLAAARSTLPTLAASALQRLWGLPTRPWRLATPPRLPSRPPPLPHPPVGAPHRRGGSPPCRWSCESGTKMV